MEIKKIKEKLWFKSEDTLTKLIRRKKMKFNKGEMLSLVVVDDISWGKEGDRLVFLDYSKKYEKNKAIIVADSKHNTHVIKEYRVAEYGNAKAIKRCMDNAPKFYAVLQDSCRNYRGERAIVGLEKAETYANDVVSRGESHTIYELVAVKRLTQEPIVTNA